ncbi:hypothetical protein K432DRAFT_380816 [Lepidopterella palustris CBS 459.81]|uniref:Uncharacterized protein n=1 Tax=Lepidopterella palustris CBS 459.81 TaxID=1314670 RepID=A0A8E2EDE1_9PEZI|nr:hypothetical protein K432DRAFT_380816 [Lepidopterella palustris CBS 459.81]
MNANHSNQSLPQYALTPASIYPPLHTAALPAPPNPPTAQHVPDPIHPRLHLPRPMSKTESTRTNLWMERLRS